MAHLVFQEFQWTYNKIFLSEINWSYDIKYSNIIVDEACQPFEADFPKIFVSIFGKFPEFNFY